MERLFIRLIWFFAVGMFLLACLLSPPVWLESENRAPEAFSLSNLDRFIRDRLPFRESLLKLNRDTVLLLGKNEYGGAFFGKSGYLFSAVTADTAVLEKNLAAAEAFAARTDVPVLTALVGAKQELLTELVPRFYESRRDALWQLYADSSLIKVDLLSTLRYQGGCGKYICYRGDHHLTSLGSYYTYTALAKALGFSPCGASDFSVSVVDASFSGSDARKLLLRTSDKIALFRYKGDSALTVTDARGSARRGLYNENALASHDKYGIFPGYGAGYTSIADGNGNHPRLLVLCDSYGCSLAPFLARHFDVDLLDLRYTDFQAVRDKMRDYTAVVLYFGMDTLASHEILYKLNF